MIEGEGEREREERSAKKFSKSFEMLCEDTWCQRNEASSITRSGVSLFPNTLFFPHFSFIT